jgi:hypothetical protein
MGNAHEAVKGNSGKGRAERNEAQPTELFTPPTGLRKIGKAYRRVVEYVVLWD